MAINKKLKVAVLPGDGIGKDVTLSAIPVLETLGVPVDIIFGDIGWEFWKSEGSPIPNRTWNLINASDAILLGAITSKPEREALNELSENLRESNLSYISPVIQLRQKMDLFANVRPCFNIKSGIRDFNFCVIRENTEGLYAGFDFYPIPNELKSMIDKKPSWKDINQSDLSCSLRLQSRFGLFRLFRFAFSYADSHNMTRVTFADKPNVLRKSSMLSREIFEEVSSAYPEIQADILNVDAVALWLVRRPEEFGVIVCENMFGDILSDLGAGVMGGLGFAPSANIGENHCYFEPVHGSGPSIKNNSANPCAMFLTISMLLDRFNYNDEADSIRNAIRNVIKQKKFLTYDLGGKSSTSDMSKAIIEQSTKPYVKKQISILATGNEIISGDVQDSNGQCFSKIISNHNMEIYQHIHSSDYQYDIECALVNLLNESDAVIVTGGLGPTSDDNTRYAISTVTKLPLVFNQQAWEHVVSRLNRFKLNITESNRQQALFPEKCELYQNDNGTAFGCHVLCNNKHIFMLPGPPKECQPMFQKYVIETLKEFGFSNQKTVHRWITLGLIEGEISQYLDNIVREHSCEIGYRWSYPYLEIKLILCDADFSAEIIERIDDELKTNIVSRSGGDSYEELNKILSSINKKINIRGDSVVEQFVLEFNHPNILFNSKLNENITLCVNITESADSIHLESFSRTNTVKYTHKMSTPNREPDMSLYIKHYAAWQICEFIKKSKLNE